MNRNNPEETADVWSVQDRIPMGAGKAQLWSFKEAEEPEAEQMPHSLTGNSFLLQPNYVNSGTETLLHRTQAPTHPTLCLPLMAREAIRKESLQEGKPIFAKVTVLIITPFL